MTMTEDLLAYSLGKSINFMQLMQNVKEYFPKEIQEAAYDALIVDLPTYLILSALTGGVVIVPTFLGTFGAFAGYAIRKSCNNYLNEGEHNEMCGLAGGAVKYLIKSPVVMMELAREAGIEVMQLPGKIIKTIMMRDTIIGAMNGALYEYYGNDIEKNIEDANSAGLFEIIVSIETYEAMIMSSHPLDSLFNIAQFVSESGSTLASLLLTNFIMDSTEIPDDL